MTLYVFRERIRAFYQKYDLYIEPVLKFLMGVVVFSLINHTIGYDQRFVKVPVTIILSLFTAFLPSAVMVILAAMISILHIYNVSKILSLIILLIMFILYLLFVRFTPKLGYIVLAVPILFILKIPYVIPIVLGITATPLTAIPTGCGIILYYLFNLIKEAASLEVGVKLEDVLQLYTYVTKSLVTNNQMIASIGIFALVILVTYLIRKLKIDYAYEIAIVTGGVVNILGFLINALAIHNLCFCDLRLDISKQIFGMIMGSIASILIAYVVLFFKQALDYTGVEYVQFEDDDYMYYVKAVPKIVVTTPQKNIKRINVQKSVDTLESEQEDEYEDYEEESYFTQDSEKE